MSTVSIPSTNIRTGWEWPALLAFIRLPLALAGSGLVILAYRLSGQPVGVAAGLGWSTFTITLVNLLCMGLLRWRARVEGFRLRDMIGFHRSRLWLDLALGVAYSLLLYILLLAGAAGLLLLLYGTKGLANIGELLYGGADFSFSTPGWVLWINVGVSALAFPLLNPLVEELQYRGYAQPRLAAATGQAWLGIGLTALGFGLQHVVFAATLPAALAFAAGFFAWGLGAGVIAHRQGRLAPLIVAHFISNLFGLVPLILMVSSM